LARLPTRRTVANWLRQFTQDTLAPLVALNRDLVADALARLQPARLTIDVDGSVIRTGSTVGWAFRGFNPHHRKDPSYYPLFAHVAQTGHILRVKNRPGNVHDSKQAVPFVREIITDLRGRFGRRVVLEFRMDAAFFQQAIVRLLIAQDCGFAVKVGYWSWLPLKEVAAACPRWEPVAPGWGSTRPSWSSRSGTTSACAWRSTASTSGTRRGRTSSWICSRPMTDTSSTRRSPRTCPWGWPACGRSHAGAARRRRP
jgi:hypothetical protein